MTIPEDRQISKYVKDNMTMRFVPACVDQVLTTITCVDQHSEQEVKLNRDQLFDAIDYCDPITQDFLCSAYKHTGFNCWSTHIQWMFDQDSNQLRELCNVAYLVDKFENEFAID